MNHTEKLIEIIKYLRLDPKGCPWTREQTHASLAPYFIEESYEAVEAIDNGDVGDNLKSELGDVLLQIALHAQIADENGRFNFDDAAKSICDKLTRRYPTILGDDKEELKTAEDVDKKWEEIKAQERAAKGATESIFDDVPHGVPALMRSQKLNKRLIRSGADYWFNKNDIITKLHEELDEVKEELEKPQLNRKRLSAEIGDLLLVTSKLAQFYDIDAENSLRQASNRIEKRWRYIERSLKECGKDLKTATKDEVGKLWSESKSKE